MEEYLCLTLLAGPGESESDFKSRLSTFWTHMLRQHEALFEKVYAETSAFEWKGACLSRKYLVEAPAIAELASVCRSREMAHEPVDRDETYSKFEAAPPEWFWIEH